MYEPALVVPEGALAGPKEPGTGVLTPGALALEEVAPIVSALEPPIPNELALVVPEWDSLAANELVPAPAVPDPRPPAPNAPVAAPKLAPSAWSKLRVPAAVGVAPNELAPIADSANVPEPDWSAGSAAVVCGVANAPGAVGGAAGAPRPAVIVPASNVPVPNAAALALSAENGVALKVLTPVAVVTKGLGTPGSVSAWLKSAGSVLVGAPLGWG
ncbi:hypothetical protein [Actinosynnema pretiosum]|uniref:hypothetical protein n=1 Tax=Actinosynnema pretiosum TaxID=42197 RepID=UPI0012FE0387|nr:hypothetical protein [Actinosynnema pretiosum]